MGEVLCVSLRKEIEKGECMGGNGEGSHNKFRKSQLLDTPDYKNYLAEEEKTWMEKTTAAI
eukprot:scaffold5179_cov109-Skeletonema_dohrnii-CCMP3373.AAC.3